MCRRPSQFCSALGEDPSTWPTNQPLPTPPGAFDVAERVTAAVLAAHDNDTARVRSILSPIDQEPFQTWFIDHAQNTFRFRVPEFHPGPKVKIPKAERDRAYPLARMEREVFERDGGRCGYCQIPVHLKKELHMVRDCAPDLFPMGRTNRSRAGAALLTRATADHILPVSQGGRTVHDNLVTACPACQFGKNAYTPEQLGMTRPAGVQA